MTSAIKDILGYITQKYPAHAIIFAMFFIVLAFLAFAGLYSILTETKVGRFFLALFDKSQAVKEVEHLDEEKHSITRAIEELLEETNRSLKVIADELLNEMKEIKNLEERNLKNSVDYDDFVSKFNNLKNDIEQKIDYCNRGIIAKIDTISEKLEVVKEKLEMIRDLVKHESDKRY